MNFGDIFLCQFPFTDGSGGKVRPALVLFDLQRDVVICRVTSVICHEPLDVVLSDWREAGLLKPSTVRLSRLVTVERTILRRKLGELTDRDRSVIRSTWNERLVL